MKPKKIRLAVKTPEELFKESGLSREEWNAEMRRKAEEADRKQEGSGFAYALMMIDTDGKSVMTKLAEGAAKAVLEEAKQMARSEETPETDEGDIRVPEVHLEPLDESKLEGGDDD